MRLGDRLLVGLLVGALLRVLAAALAGLGAVVLVGPVSAAALKLTSGGKKIRFCFFTVTNSAMPPARSAP